MNWKINQYNSFIIVVTYNKGILYKEVTSILLHHKETHVACSVETGSGHPGHPGHPGQPGHIFSGSSGSDPVYKLSGSDPDWIT